MKNKTVLNTFNGLFLGISILGLLSVSLLSLYHPQGTMDLVNVKLDNNDAISSIRGVYGGVGVTLITGLVYLIFTRIELAIRFLTLFWGTYALSRLITILVNGPLGAFGNQWIMIESVLCFAGLGLMVWNRGSKENNSQAV